MISKILGVCVSLAMLAGGLVLQPTWPWTAAGLLLLSPVFALVGLRCTHAGHLGLLPATVDMHGTLRPARWRCDTCEKVWPADFTKTTEPDVRFAGFDESLQQRARHRASTHADARRELESRRGAAPQAKAVAPFQVRRK